MFAISGSFLSLLTISEAARTRSWVPGINPLFVSELATPIPLIKANKDGRQWWGWLLPISSNSDINTCWPKNKTNQLVCVCECVCVSVCVWVCVCEEGNQSHISDRPEIVLHLDLVQQWVLRPFDRTDQETCEVGHSQWQVASFGWLQRELILQQHDELFQATKTPNGTRHADQLVYPTAKTKPNKWQWTFCFSKKHKIEPKKKKKPNKKPWVCGRSVP